MKKYKFLFFSFLFFTLHSSLFTLFAQPPEVEKLFDQAAEKYLAHDWAGAAADLKEVVKKDPGNLKAIGLLGRALTSLAKDSHAAGDLDGALSVAEEALKYTPELKEARDAQASITKDIEKRDDVKIEEQKRRAYAAKREREEELAREKLRAESNQRLAEETRIREEREKSMRGEIEKTKKDLGERKEEIEILRQQTHIIATRWLIFFSIAVFIVVAASFLISSRVVSNISLRLREEFSRSSDRTAELIHELAAKGDVGASLDDLKSANAELLEKIAANRSHPLEENLMKQAENLISVVEKSVKGASASTENVEFESAVSRSVITDISSANRARAKSVVSIARAVNNPALAARLIAPFLKDKNNRVRADAAVEMFRFDAVASENTLKEMVQSENKWDRISAAWAAGEIADISVMNFLETLIEDYDPLVKARAIASAKKAEEILKAKFPATLRVKIQRKT
ncbi:MAG: HEAT repeat domain-containing protein [bacterium]